jgi:uncharacterized membrane-anchored protein YhcB (DUF1043 family)
MSLILVLIVGLVIGFVAGFLVFRNNQKKINEVEVTAIEVVEDVKTTAAKVKKAVKKVKE